MSNTKLIKAIKPYLFTTAQSLTLLSKHTTAAETEMKWILDPLVGQPLLASTDPQIELLRPSLLKPQ